MIDPQDFQDAEPDLLSNHASDIIKRIKENSDQCTMALRSLCSRKKGLTVEVCFCSVLLYSASMVLCGLLCMMNRIILTLNWTLELHYLTVPEIYPSKKLYLKFNPADMCEFASSWTIILCLKFNPGNMSEFTSSIISETNHSYVQEALLCLQVQIEYFIVRNGITRHFFPCLYFLRL